MKIHAFKAVNSVLALMVFFPLLAYISYLHWIEVLHFPLILIATFSLILLSLLAHSAKIMQNNRMLVFAMIVSIIYFHEFGGFAFIYFLLFASVVAHPSLDKSDFYAKLKITVEILIVIFAANHFLYMFGLTNPIELNYDDRNVYLHGFMQHLAIKFEPTRLQSWRFYGFANEPGLLAAIIMLFLVYEKLKVKGNLILWSAGALTFSSGFFAIMLIYFIYFYRFKLKSYVYLLLTLIVLYAVLPGYMVNLFEIMILKIFEAKELEMRFESHSFTKYWSAYPYLLLLYMFAILLTPKRFWLFFVLIGLYRQHFIFTAAVPLIVAISSTFFQKVNLPILSGMSSDNEKDLKKAYCNRDVIKSNTKFE